MDQPYPDQSQQESSTTESELEVFVPASLQLETATTSHPEHASAIPSSSFITPRYLTLIRKPPERYTG